MLTMLLLGKAASPRPGRPSHGGLGGAEDEDDEEVGLLNLSSLLSPRSLDRLGLGRVLIEVIRVPTSSGS